MIADNCYEDRLRAEAYAKLEFPGTYYLAYRDLPRLILERAAGGKALDFGCGAGRSTRFLRQLGFDVVGVDIAADMLRKAREIDPRGDYRLIADEDLDAFADRSFDLILSAFTFDSIPTMARKVAVLATLKRLLAETGTIVNLVSTPEIYVHEWASFSTKDFPGNKAARCGDKVKIIITEIEDARPVEDVIWPDPDYRAAFESAGLELLDTHKPLARPEEPFRWVNETRIAPWAIYLLGRPAAPSRTRSRPGTQAG